MTKQIPNAIKEPKNLGFYEITQSIYKQYKTLIDTVNKKIEDDWNAGYALVKVDTGEAQPLQNYYNALGYKAVIHTGRTRDTIAIGWEI